MRSWTPAVVLLSGLIVFSFACEEDSGAGPGGAGIDAGFPNGGSPDGSSPSGPGAPDAGSDDGGGPDPLAPIACSAPLRIDSLRGVDGASAMSIAQSGNRWLVLWYQIGAVAEDSQEHLKARFFDGTALGTELDVATNQTYAPPLPIAVDGDGRGFTQFAEPTAQQVAIDFGAGTFTKTAFALGGLGNENPVAMAPLAPGGALSVYQTGSGVAADRWNVGEQKWKATNLTGAAPINGLQVATNSAGKGAATWYASDGGTGIDLTVSTWDGAIWKNTSKNFPLDSGLSVSSFRHAVLANGDVQLLWQVGSRYVKGAVYHPAAAAGAEWDAPTTFRDAGVSGTLSQPLLVVDVADRLTVGWLEQSKAWVRRGTGTTLADPVDLGLASSFRLVLDPFSNLTAVMFDLSDRIALRRSPATGSAWGARAATGVGISNGTQIGRQAGVVFDATGHPTVISQNEVSGAGVGLGLVYAVCR